MGNYIGDVAKDPQRERARLRIKTYRRRDWSRLTDITPEFEIALRAKAKRCPLCRVILTDVPFLPHSKELDHIVPRVAGGTHTMGNVRIICRQCNQGRPWDGSDYAGPVTLWAEEPGFVPPADVRRAAIRCEHGIPAYYRCRDCRPLAARIPRVAVVRAATWPCLDCGATIQRHVGPGRPRKFCAHCRPPMRELKAG